MAFRITVLIISEILPLFVLLCGLRFRRGVPYNVLTIISYRTEKSMRSRASWDYAHNLCGRIWVVLGAVTAAVAAAAVTSASFFADAAVGYTAAIVMMSELAAIIISAACVEHALGRAFDKNGRRT